MTVKELLDSEEKWCQRANAKDAEGRKVYSNNPEAVRWCLIGAMLRCFGDDYELAYNRVKKLIDVSPATFNDAPGRTFAEIREVIEKADI